MILQPKTATPNLKKDTVRLSFDMGPSPIEMQIRGAVAWPEGGIPGICLVAGYNIKEKTVWIFADYTFMTVHPNYDYSKRCDIGLQLFLRESWIKYGCNQYYYANDHDDIHKLYSRQVYRDEILKPINIQFIRSLYTDEKTADDLIRYRVSQKTLFWNANSELNSQQKDPDSRGRLALRVLVAGFEYLPWIDYSKPQKLKEYYI